MFDYIFYRTYNYYLSMKGEKAYFNATLYTTVLKLLFLLACLILIDAIFLNDQISLIQKKIRDLYEQIGIVLFHILLTIYNYIRYKKKLPKILKRYKNHFLNKHINGAIELTIFYGIIFFGLLFGPYILLKIFGFS